MFTPNTTKNKEEKILIEAVSAIFLHISDNSLQTVSLFLVFPFPWTISRFCCHVTNTKKCTEVRKNTFTIEVSNRFKATWNLTFVF